MSVPLQDALDVCNHGGTMPLPGDELKSGRQFWPQPQGTPDFEFLKSSPSIRYCKAGMRASDGSIVQIALELLQAPGAYNMREETIGWRQKHTEPLDPRIPADEVGCSDPE